MTSDTIITQFELQVGDVTELSTSEEFVVLNRVYNKICNFRPWEFLKTSASGTMSSDSEGYYITAPTDFAYFANNHNNTEDYIGTDTPKVIFVGTNYDPYMIVNWSDRRQYRNKAGYAYYDITQDKIRFTGTPVSTTYEFDYVKVPAALITAESPVFPSRFHEILVYGMAVDNEIIQLSPKAKSYAVENQAKYQSMFDDMSYWNANLLMN
jgi:hypothetical protein